MVTPPVDITGILLDDEDEDPDPPLEEDYRRNVVRGATE